MTNPTSVIQKQKLLRRTFLKAGAAFALVTPALMRTAWAQDSFQLKASTFPPPANGAVGIIKSWIEELEERTGGQIKTSLFPSSQMGPPNRQYDLVRDGAADFSWVLHGFTPGRFPLTDIADLPDMFASAQQGTSALAKVSGLLEPEHKGVKVLSLVSSTPLVIMSANKVIRTPDDLKGLRVRPPSGVIAETIQVLGGVSVAVPPAEMTDALSKGVIDAIVTSAEAAASFKLFEAVKHVTEVNMGVATFAFVMNPDRYDNMSDELKAEIDSMSGPALSSRFGEMFDKSEAKARSSAQADGVEFIIPEPDAAAGFAKIFEDNRTARVAAMVAGGKAKAQQVYDMLNG